MCPVLNGMCETCGLPGHRNEDHETLSCARAYIDLPLVQVLGVISSKLNDVNVVYRFLHTEGIIDHPIGQTIEQVYEEVNIGPS